MERLRDRFELKTDAREEERKYLMKEINSAMERIRELQQRLNEMDAEKEAEKLSYDTMYSHHGRF